MVLWRAEYIVVVLIDQPEQATALYADPTESPNECELAMASISLAVWPLLPLSFRRWRHCRSLETHSEKIANAAIKGKIEDTIKYVRAC